MNKNKLKQQWIQEEQHAFEGWDFSHISNRCKSDSLPWKYTHLVQSNLKETDNLLDMGTGGGEFLLTLNHPYALTSVTESYFPNVKLCKEKLSSLGITVKQTFSDKCIPYKDSYFDIVINRHESFDAKEVNRILKTNKLFITQQVGGDNNIDLSKRLLGTYEHEHKHHTLFNNIKLLKDAGFDILYSNECYTPIKFYDIGAFVYFAKIISWEFPSFSVDKYFDKLLEFQNQVDEKGYLEGKEHRFVIIATKK